MAVPSADSYANIYGIRPDILRRPGWWMRQAIRVSRWWGGLSTAQRVGIGFGVIAASAVLSIATGGISAAIKKGLKGAAAGAVKKGAAGAASRAAVVGSSAALGGTIRGVKNMLAAETGARNRAAAFAGGFVDGAISTGGLAIGLAFKPNALTTLGKFGGWAGGFGIATGLGGVGGGMGSLTEQGISDGGIDGGVIGLNAGIGAAANALAFALFRYTMDMGEPFGVRLVEASKPSHGGFAFDLMEWYTTVTIR